MREDLRELWDRVQARKWRVLEAVARMPEDVRSRKVPGSGWTPVQIIEHLVLAEEDSLTRIGEAAKTDTSVRPSLAFKIGVRAMRTGIRVPASPSMIPSDGSSLEELAERWEKVRERLAGALEEENDRRAFAVNPVFGALGAEHVLELMDSHLLYHQKQLGAL